ncbi:hypothetical protein FACS1894191_8480 [Clostridia bacterium]|nr:hypothetical protein FACS1894191_8480 [Clostridia bacterium]
MQNPSPKQQLTRLLGITNWSRHHLADLLEITTFSFNRYLSGHRKPKPETQEKIDTLYNKIIPPLECEIETLRNKAEKSLLSSRIKTLSTPTCDPSSPSCP